MSHSVLDHTQDLTGREQHRLTILYPPPDFVKTAQHDRLYGDPEQMLPHLYADQLNRLYPLHTAPAVWMSTLFFQDKKAELDTVKADVIEARLNNAADYFSIRPQIEHLKEAMTKAAHYDLANEPDENFALVWTGPDANDSKERHYPLRNANEVKMAAHWFETYRDEFLFNDRSRIAQKIHEKAAQHSVALDNAELIEKTAGYGHCPTVEIIEMVKTRSHMTNRTHPTESRELMKVAELLSQDSVDARDTGIRQKLASIVDQFDRVTKLNRMYDEGGLDRPEEILFKLTEKHANDFIHNHIQMQSGTIYKRADFDSIDLDHVRSWMGDEFADEIAAGVYVDGNKLADIAATLPRGDAEVFDRMVSEAGISPYARDKAAHATGIPLHEMAAMAAYYEHDVLGRTSSTAPPFI